MILSPWYFVQNIPFCVIYRQYNCIVWFCSELSQISSFFPSYNAVLCLYSQSENNRFFFLKGMLSVQRCQVNIRNGYTIHDQKPAFLHLHPICKYFCLATLFSKDILSRNTDAAYDLGR